MPELSAGKCAGAMAAGSFLGGLVAGSLAVQFLAVAALSIVGALVAVLLTDPQWKEYSGHHLGTVLGSCTVIALPCGFVGMMLGSNL